VYETVYGRKAHQKGNEDKNMSTSILESPRLTAPTGKAEHQLVHMAKAIGGTLSFSSLALSSAQFYRVSSATLGPGAFMLSIPKILCGSLAPFSAVVGAVGVACGLSALWLERSSSPKAIKRPGLGAPLVVVAGLAGAAISAVYTRKVLASRGDFATAFGADWQQRIPLHLKGRMLPQRWAWKLSVVPGAHVERDMAFATVPGTDRKLLADVWSPPNGVTPSGLGFIYLHGGGYSAFDKGGPTELWFRHLASQGHVVMDVAYRLIPETSVPGMQGDVKRAVAWLKRNASRYGVNPDRIVLGGGSGGSHLALLAAYAPDHPLFTPQDVRGVDLSVRGVIGYYNAGDYRLESWPNVKKTALQRAVTGLLTSLFERFIGAEIAVDETGNWDPKLFFGGTPDAWPELYRQISPIVQVGPVTPPTLQIVGEHDIYGGARSAAALHAKLQAAGVPAIELRIPRTDHAFDLVLPAVSPAAQTAMYDVDRFLALMASPVDWKAGHHPRQEVIAR
jgi:acetyl esterase/lipase